MKDNAMSDMSAESAMKPKLNYKELGELEALLGRAIANEQFSFGVLQTVPAEAKVITAAIVAAVHGISQPMLMNGEAGDECGGAIWIDASAKKVLAACIELSNDVEKHAMNGKYVKHVNYV